MGTALGVIDDSVFTDVRDVLYFTMVRTESASVYESLEIYFFFIIKRPATLKQIEIDEKGDKMVVRSEPFSAVCIQIMVCR